MGGEEGDRLKKEEEWGIFFPAEVLSIETTFLKKKKKRPMQCFHNCCIPRSLA